jgi:hypothetical protein
LNQDGKEFSVVLRCLDVYRREGGDWIQCASHIGFLPDEAASIVPTSS